VAKCESRFLATVLVNTKTRFSSEVRTLDFSNGQYFANYISGLKSCKSSNSGT
jgi:hypothetical protein